MDTLTRFYRKAIWIDANSHLTQYQKDSELAELMTAMERIYKIPMLRNEQWERDNSDIISIYRKISDMRKL